MASSMVIKGFSTFTKHVDVALLLICFLTSRRYLINNTSLEMTL